MARIPNQNPGSSEVQSPLVAGIVEALNKISDVLSMNTSTMEDVKLNVVNIEGETEGRIFEAPEGKRLWLSSPTPTFKKNGSPITPESNNFTVDFVGGSITFDGMDKPSKSDNITVSATYISNSSELLSGLSSGLDEAKQLSQRYKGAYDSLENLQSGLPTAEKGDFALVVDEMAFYAFDTAWKNTQSIEDLSNYYNKTETDQFLKQKEGTIAPHGTDPGDDQYYWGGRKTWQSLQTNVMAVQLVGLSLDDDSAVADGDSIIVALGKIASTIDKTSSKHFIEGTGAPSTSTQGSVGQRYVNTSNGDVYTCKSVSGSTYTWEKDVDRQEFTSLSQSVSQKANKASGATDGNFAALDADGNLTDSGKKPADFVPVVPGKGLSTNDYTNKDKAEVAKVKDKANKAVAISASLTVEGWTGDAAPYTQTIAAAGVTADTSQVVEVGGAENLTAEQYEAMVAAQLWAKSKAEGTVTIEAKGEKPAVALPVVVVIYG